MKRACAARVVQPEVGAKVTITRVERGEVFLLITAHRQAERFQIFQCQTDVQSGF